MMTLAGVLLPPLLSSFLAMLIRPYRRITGWISLVCAGVSFAAAGALCAEAVTGGRAGNVGWNSDIWRVDALSALLALCIAFVSLLASALAPGLRRNDSDGAS